ncbi:hypothetical protein HYPSUDRAFT_893722 [Hypholoma sublateritium FD-334 SS-4]|uniref:Uncharacterized protein n=1 Tax=Hypholoma sublateritium (strain FD-334 SS-4) TaxID=945553 RepID=A0A0D2NRQ8_HYPSF|nr:hypothetical protein HYPSUDRAFT_893722 [Hypholoma sublateritium FD-334 SS-4]
MHVGIGAIGREPRSIVSMAVLCLYMPLRAYTDEVGIEYSPARAAALYPARPERDGARCLVLVLRIAPSSA